MIVRVTRTSDHEKQNTESPCAGAFKGSWIENKYGVDEEIEAWLLEVGSIEELLYFCDKYGYVVVQSTAGYVTLEIYDAYRE